MNSYNRFFNGVLVGVFMLLGLFCPGCYENRQVEELIEDLNGKSSERKICAVQTLAEMKNPAAVEAVIAALGNKAASVRRASARALGRMNGQLVGHALRDALEHWDPDVRREAAWALWQSTDDPVLLVQLRHHLEDL